MNNTDNYDLIIEAEKVLSSNAGFYTKKKALDYVYNEYMKDNSIIKDLEKEVHGITKKIHNLKELIDKSINAIKEDKRSINYLLSMHKKEKITKEEYALIEKYAPGINKKIEDLSKIKINLGLNNDNLNELDKINIEEYKNKEKEFNLKLKELENKRKIKEISFPLSGDEVRKKEDYIDEINNEEIKILKELEKINYIIEIYNRIPKTNIHELETKANIKTKEEIEKENEKPIVLTDITKSKELINDSFKSIEEITKDSFKEKEIKNNAIIEELLDEFKMAAIAGATDRNKSKKKSNEKTKLKAINVEIKDTWYNEIIKNN